MGKALVNQDLAMQKKAQVVLAEHGNSQTGAILWRHEKKWMSGMYMQKVSWGSLSGICISLSRTVDIGKLNMIDKVLTVTVSTW